MDDARDKQIANAVINARQHDRENLAIDHAAYVVGQYRLEIESRIRAEALKEAADRAIRWVHGFGVELLCYDDHGNDLDGDIGLRAAILSGKVKK
jgi:hypothetical protein